MAFIMIRSLGRGSNLLAVFFPTPQAYNQSVRITSHFASPLDVTLKPGAADRYTISPAQLRIAPGESADFVLRLKVLKFAARAKAEREGQRDVVHIKVHKNVVTSTIVCLYIAS